MTPCSINEKKYGDPKPEMANPDAQQVISSIVSYSNLLRNNSSN
jgi:hypothetical protein